MMTGVYENCENMRAVRNIFSVKKCDFIVINPVESQFD